MVGPSADGIRVVDLTSYIAGSYAAMMLADLGADVFKVESLAGDSFRELPGFVGWNRGKQSIAVDLKTADGRTIVERLATGADVVMENMRPGVADRLGVGYAALRALNPRLIRPALNPSLIAPRPLLVKLLLLRPKVRPRIVPPDRP